MDFYWLALGTLGTWRLTHFFAVEDGPFAAVARLRRFAGSSVLGQMLDCFYCLSMWSAALIAVPLAQSALHYIYLSLAFSAGSILLESLAHKRGDPEAVFYEPELGNDDIVLREVGVREDKGGGFRHAHGFGD